ncbi:MAG: DUF3187 family protein [Proteobacteria bacterium]|nr:DUF3187 family protein [Pseudomonadota bacterium]
MKMLISFCVIVQILCLSLPAGAIISSNTRLLQKPEWDGAVVSGHWLNGEIRYQKAELDDEDVNFITIGPTFATSLPNVDRLELGGRLWLMRADYDNFESESGLGDMDLWAKYQLYNQNNLTISGGLLLTFPSGSDGIVHKNASGELNMEVFGAARFNLSDIIAVIGHIGIRNNGDMEVDLENESNGNNVHGELDGESQIEIGGGVIYQLQPNLCILGELNIASEAYDDSENDIEFTGGVEYILGPSMAVKGGMGFGLDDGAPDFELIGSCVYTF